MSENDLRVYNILKRYKVVTLVNIALTIKDSGMKGFTRKLKERRQKKAIIENVEKNINNENVKEENVKKTEFRIGYIDVVIGKNINPEDVIGKLKKSNHKFNYFTFTKNDNSQTINNITFNKIFSLRAFIYITENEECKFDLCFNFRNDEDLLKNVEEALTSINGLKLLSNYNEKNNISVKASTFFNYEGTNYYSGGAERYLIDLHDVCKNMGVNLNIYQNAEKPFFRKYNNINVIGLVVKGMPLNYSIPFMEEQTQNYIYHTFNNTKLHIYSAFQECFPNHVGPSIGISHGVAWDHKFVKSVDGTDFWLQKKIFIESAMMCDKLISVDTNTANWFQTIDYNLGNQKFSVIPNYVDTKEFAPAAEAKKKDKIIITYPRRLYEPRGLYIVLNIIDKILKKYDNVEFHFVGKGFKEDLDNIEKKIKQYPNKIFCYNKSPNEMHEVYKKSDISLIPTQYSEGTSLSCLEALASGNIVVATRIGGLTDLVINNFNGYLIEPNENALLKSIENILDNYEKQDVIRKRAIETAEAFNKETWKERWTEAIKTFNIKEKSENNKLIEVNVNDVNKISKGLISKIEQELQKGNLVYIRTKKMPKTDLISHDLLQIVDEEEEKVSIPEKVLNED